MSQAPFIKNDLYWLKLQEKLYERSLQRGFRRLRSAGIEPIIIKGWAIAKFYPENVIRTLGDIDFCVEPTLFDAAKVILAAEKGGKISVDLHCGLRHLDTLQWEDLYKNSRLVKLEDTDIRVLRPEDHLRVICVHWLTDGGEYEKKLWDVYYLIQNRPADFDWDRCLNKVGATRRKWIVTTILLAHKYLGLDLNDTPLAGETGDIPGWIIKTIEREWKSDLRLKSLRVAFNHRGEFWQQIKKRIPPNPIQATVDLEGEFDNKPRIFYQIGDTLYRLNQTLGQFAKEFFRK